MANDLEKMAEELWYRMSQQGGDGSDLYSALRDAFEAGAMEMQKLCAEYAEYPLEGKGWIWSKGVDEVCDHIEAKIRAIDVSKLGNDDD
jgi:hypothetical protein